VTAIYEIIPAGAADADGAAPLRYQRRVPRGRAGDELMFVRVRYRGPEGGASRLVERVVRDRPEAELSADFRWAVAVAEFGMLLRNSEFRGGSSVAHVLEEARGAMGGDPGGWRHEFVRLVESYRGLAAAAERGGH
jgi:Ca-activated chloride channel family protein